MAKSKGSICSSSDSKDCIVSIVVQEACRDGRIDKTAKKMPANFHHCYAICLGILGADAFVSVVDVLRKEMLVKLNRLKITNNSANGGKSKTKPARPFLNSCFCIYYACSYTLIIIYKNHLIQSHLQHTCTFFVPIEVSMQVFICDRHPSDDFALFLNMAYRYYI